MGYHRRLHTVGLDITILIPVFGKIFMSTTQIDDLSGKFRADYYFNKMIVFPTFPNTTFNIWERLSNSWKAMLIFIAIQSLQLEFLNLEVFTK